MTLGTAPAVSDAEGLGIAVDTYVYGYPLVTMEMTRKVMINIAQADGHHAPMGQFANMRAYPTAQFRDVTAPNADTLYSSAWLDLSKEPHHRRAAEAVQAHRRAQVARPGAIPDGVGDGTAACDVVASLGA
jgi:hypothetical protein